MIALSLCGCTCDDDASNREPSLADDPKLRLDARVVLAEHCGDCHMQDSPYADKAALAAVDFTKVTWAAGLDPLDGRRVVDNLALGATASGHHGAQFSIPPGQYMVVRDYLASIESHKQHVSNSPDLAR